MFSLKKRPEEHSYYYRVMNLNMFYLLKNERAFFHLLPYLLTRKPDALFLHALLLQYDVSAHTTVRRPISCYIYWLHIEQIFSLCKSRHERIRSSFLEIKISTAKEKYICFYE